MSESRWRSHDGRTPVRPDLVALTTALGEIEVAVRSAEDPDVARVELIRQLEVLRCATEAAQAAVTRDFADSQVAAQAAAGVPAARQGRGVAAQVGLARRESVHCATFHLGLARLVIGDLPHVAAAWRAGRLTEYRVQKIAAAACVLARPERLALDARLAGTPDAVETLEGLGDRAVEAKANEVAYDLDKLSYLARRERAVAERHTSLRPAPDGMTWFSALVSLKEGVSMHASLTAAATAARSAGDPRTRGQVMADTLLDRVTGRTDGRSGQTPVPVHVEIVVPVDVVTGVGEHADATCWAPAYGPVPADVAREWAEHADTHTRIWADAATGQVIGTESRSQARTYPHSLATYARRRDRTCRIPWCDAPVRHIDHSTDHAHGGETSTHNAGGLCEAHNHAKQAPGWTALTNHDPDGTHAITYTTPTGHTHTSRPPPSYPPRE